MTEKIKKTSPKILLETGLLFEINRQILHPFGLALEVIIDDKTGNVKLGQIWDYRDDPEGMLFGDDYFAKGLEKFKKFMKETGMKKLQERKRRLGFIIQKSDAEELDPDPDLIDFSEKGG